MEVNDKSKTWEEEMYWKYFHAMHFYQRLPNDFHDHLVLPSKFAENMSSKLSNKVSLIGPSSSTWDVEITKSDDTLALAGNGWKDFVKAYNLEENALVLFKYEQKSTFKVLIFDPTSKCENESSYFVKKFSPEPASTELIEDSDDDDDGSDKCILYKKQKGDSEQERGNNPENPWELPCNPSSEDEDNDKPDDPDNIAKVVCQLNEEEPTPIATQEKEVYEKAVLEACNLFSEPPIAMSKVKLLGKYYSPKRHLKRGTPTKPAKTVKKPASKSETKRVSKEQTSIRRQVTPETKRVSKEYTSMRRQVTGEEIENALRRANEVVTEGSFTVVMRPTAVYKRFFLSIPSDWMHKNLDKQNHEVILRVGEKTWSTMFYYNIPRSSGGLASSGWRNFATENNLEESDVCVFKPASQKDDAPFVLDVQIFRVVEEMITPLPLLICSI